MAIRNVHRNDKEAREFSQKLLGRGILVPYRPKHPFTDQNSSTEQKTEPSVAPKIPEKK